MQEEWKKAIAQINLPVVERRGTGFLVTPRLVLTALHVVADRTQRPPMFYGGPIELIFTSGHQTHAQVLPDTWNPDADWVVLECDEPPACQPIPLLDLGSGKPDWETYGFPAIKPDGMKFEGHVADWYGNWNHVPAMQLFSVQAAASGGSPVHGLSGAPCIISGAAVGLLRSSLLQDESDRPLRNMAGTLYACPISTVLAQCAPLQHLPIRRMHNSLSGEVDWRSCCREMLERQICLTTNPLTTRDGIRFELDDVYIPLGLEKRQRRAHIQAAVANSPRQTATSQESDTDEKIQTLEQDEFFGQVLGQGQSPISQGKRLAIIGDPGAGKTTLLQKTAHWILSNTDGYALWVSLADLQGKDLETYLLEGWLKAAVKTVRVTNEMKDALGDLFNSGRVWLLLDGVDELGVERGSPLSTLARQLTGWIAGARVVLTCRTNVWDTGQNVLDMFDVYRTLEFRPEQIGQFIDRWFSDSVALAQGLRMELDQEGRGRMKDMVQNPLRLALLCYYWKLRQGRLPRTKAALYQRFVEAWYEWKQEHFPTKSAERHALNAALGQLALIALDQKDWRFRLPHHGVCRVLGEPDTPLFQLARQLGWLLQLGVAAENPEEAVYAFPHPTFQEYFAAQSMQDWRKFLDHKAQNPSQGIYRVFDAPWKEVILLWLGREDIVAEEKEQFINALVDFEDGCRDFYRYQAYLLAAAGIAEFAEYSQGDAIVGQLTLWAHGHFDEEEQAWYVPFDPFKKAAQTTLRETDPDRAIGAIHGILDVLQESEALWNPRIFREAMENLAAVSVGDPDTVDSLMEWLCKSRKIDHTRARVIEVLKSNLYAMQSLTRRLLHSQTIATRVTAIRRLGQIGASNRNTVEALLQVLSISSDPEIQQSAIESLGELGVHDSRAIERLVGILSTGETVDMRREAMRSLGKIGHGHQGAIKALINLVETARLDEKTYDVAIASLASIGVGSNDVIRLYTQCLRADADEYFLWQRLEELGEIGASTRDTGVVQVLKDLLEISTEETVHWRAARSLGKVDPGNTRAVETLLELLRSCQSETSCRKETPFNAARSLEELGSYNEPATRILMEVLHSSKTVRAKMAVVSCLWHLGMGQPQAIAALINILQTAEDESLLMYAADTLAKIGTGDPTAVKALSDFLHSKGHQCHSMVVQHLDAIGVGHHVILEALIDLLRFLGDEEQFTYRQTIECLEKMAHGEQYVIDALLDLLTQTHNENNCQQIIWALGKIATGNMRVAEELIKVLHTSQDEKTLGFAARSLETLLSPDLFSFAVASLKDCMQDSGQANDADRYKECFNVLWHCAQNLSYPDFYRAWHSASHLLQ